MPQGLLNVHPEVVFEVLSRNCSWSDVLSKIEEYLAAGVEAVCVADDNTQTIRTFGCDNSIRVFQADDELTLPGILDGFAAKVSRFFE